jgi:hypothetical protein
MEELGLSYDELASDEAVALVYYDDKKRGKHSPTKTCLISPLV